MQGKVSLKDSAATQVYVGIDVCKKWLDVAIHPFGHTARFENSVKGLKALEKLLAQYRVALIVMEATGKLHRNAHAALHRAGFAVAIVNPLRARLFAQSAGALAKTDRLDAKLLAVLAESLKPNAIVPMSQLMQDLQELMRARQAAVDDHVMLSNQIGSSSCAFVARELKRRQTALEASIVRLEREMQRLIKSDPSLERRFKIAMSIPGVGPVAAGALVIGLAELGSCSAKQAAMLAGLAPVAADSGDSKGARHIKGGRGDVRRGIYMAALTATVHNKDLKRFYDRLIDEGKLPKVALTAVMRKLVVLVNTLLTENRLWLPEAPKHA